MTAALRNLRLGAALVGIERGLLFVRRMAFVDRRLGHPDELGYQGVERVKFLRRTAHVVSILILSCGLAAALSASQTVAEQRDQTNNSAPITREHYESDMRAITEELRAIRDDAAKSEEERANREQSWREWLFWGDAAPVWSNWILAGIAFSAGIVAIRAFNHERQAVRSTERADVLFAEAKFFDPIRNQYSGELDPHTHLVMVEKNYGRTTATNVRVRWRFFMEGQPIPDTEFLPPIVMGAGREQETKFPRFGEAMTPILEDILAERAVLIALGEVRFSDVFGDEHHATFRGRFLSVGDGAGSFSIEVEQRS